jgi:hypothetical protein
MNFLSFFIWKMREIKNCGSVMKSNKFNLLKDNEGIIDDK